ncbi:MAG: hypothetical protein OEZ06_31460 [Myxococcales bacterium]|nr:hypothetical protein [Myxococcales bacterium]
MTEATISAAFRVPGPHTSYTLGRHSQAEARVGQDLARLATGVGGELGGGLRALLLVGPFARAEGGVLMRDGEPVAHPGYDLLAVIRRRAERHARAMAALGATWSRLLHTRVRIAAVAPSDLRSAPPTRFYYHVGRLQALTLYGDPRMAALLPRYTSAKLRDDVWTLRLCEGLSCAALSFLERRPLPVQLAGLQQAVLASAEARLLLERAYAPTFAQRQLSLRTLQAPAAVQQSYQEAQTFLATPDRWQPERGTAEEWLSATRRNVMQWVLELEQRRAGTPLSLVPYLETARNLLPADAILGRLQRAALRLPDRLGDSARLALRSPLERLLRASIALAAEPGGARVRAAAAHNLALEETTHPTDAALAAGLQAMWRRVSTTGPHAPFLDYRVVEPV